MDPDVFTRWLERYFGAWRSNDQAEVEALFTDEAVYAYGPFSGSVTGRAAIVQGWVEGGVKPGLETWFEVLAVAGDRGVAHWRVSYDAPEGTRETLDGILVCDLDQDGRCSLHREWFARRSDPR